MKHNLIILLGVQGSGKGTVAKELLSIYKDRNTDIKYVETGAIFRRELKAETELGKTAAEYMQKGLLVPDDLTFKIVQTELATGADILTDGFPRNRAQAKMLVDWAAENNFTTKVVLLHITREMAEQRILKRISQGAGRADDNDPTAVAKRLDTYYAETEPMEEYLRNAPGIEFLTVDGGRAEEVVLTDILSKLGITATPEQFDAAISITKFAWGETRPSQ